MSLSNFVNSSPLIPLYFIHSSYINGIHSYRLLAPYSRGLIYQRYRCKFCALNSQQFLMQNISHIEPTPEDLENSCKTFMTEALTADTNSRSNTSVCFRPKNPSQLKTTFDYSSFKRASSMEDTIAPLKKKTNQEETSIVKVTKQEPSKNQKLKIPTKKILQQRKLEVKKMLEVPCLREKFVHLLPDHMKLKIGYIHTKLIQKMCCIDRCILIITKGANKILTFQEVQNSSRKSLKMDIDQSDLRQIIYLNENFLHSYIIDWIKNDNNNQYNLSIKIPDSLNDIYSEDARKSQFRKGIHSFLMNRYFDYLRGQNIVASPSVDKWQHGFDVENVRVPLGDIPLHPLQKKNSLCKMETSMIQNINNKDLKQIIQDTIAISKKQSDKVQETIYKQPLPFKNKLYKIIKSKQEFFQQEKKLSVVDQQSPKTKQLIKFCEQSCALFIQRRISTMFMMSFLQLIRKRMEMNLHLPQIESILNQVLEHRVKFLSKLSSPKGSMIQINKENYNLIISDLQKA